MLKDQRLELIQDMVKQSGVVEVTDLTKTLGVTEMTIRRDLKKLEADGAIQRIHGGAKLPNQLSTKELSHSEKKDINTEEKKNIARSISSLIEADDTIFLGPGTTIELVYDYLTVLPLRVITNSIHIFNKFNQGNGYDLMLIGGSYRSRTGAFVGSVTNRTLSELRVKKAFIGVNGVSGNKLFTSNEEEGNTQSIILDNAFKRYIVADHSKIDKEDFFAFYNLDETTALITDKTLTEDKQKEIEKYTKIIK